MHCFKRSSESIPVPGDSPSVTLIVTVKNEESSITGLLDSIRTQTRLPDAILVVDGGSTDRTLDLLESGRGDLPLTVISLPGATISEGRNAALVRASGEIVAVTDAGVRLDPSWLAALISPFDGDDRDTVDVVSGFFGADPRSFFELVLGATTLPDAVEIDPDRFLPSSRSLAFRRSWYQAGIQYPEWLDYCEDLIFDLRLRRAGARFCFRPSAFVWFRPRRTLGAYFRQYYRYARGDGKAGLFTRRHVIRYLTYLVLLPAIVLRRDRRLTLFAAAGAAAYMRRPWERLWRRRASIGWGRLAGAMMLAPVLRLTGDLAKMAGYPVGLAWRQRRFGLRKGWPSIPEQRNLTDRASVVPERIAEEVGRP